MRKENCEYRNLTKTNKKIKKNLSLLEEKLLFFWQWKKLAKLFEMFTYLFLLHLFSLYHFTFFEFVSEVNFSFNMIFDGKNRI